MGEVQDLLVGPYLFEFLSNLPVLCLALCFHLPLARVFFLLCFPVSSYFCPIDLYELQISLILYSFKYFTHVILGALNCHFGLRNIKCDHLKKKGKTGIG